MAMLVWVEAQAAAASTLTTWRTSSLSSLTSLVVKDKEVVSSKIYLVLVEAVAAPMLAEVEAFVQPFKFLFLKSSRAVNEPFLFIAPNPVQDAQARAQAKGANRSHVIPARGMDRCINSKVSLPFAPLVPIVREKGKSLPALVKLAEALA